MKHYVQIVKTTIRWQDNDGNILGAVREKQIELPQWGKKRPMREEIRSFIADLESSAASAPEQPNNFAGYAFKAFSKDNIVSIKSKTARSFIHLKGDELHNFLKENG
jgi:hypothetical protein